jgi:hypothetical protein
LIFNLWSRVAVKLGEERHVFDRATLMFDEVQEIERVTELSYAEWQRELARYSITAVAALLHILRKRDGMPSDFKTIQFAVADLDVVPLHDDDSEYTTEEATAELQKRLTGAAPPNGAGPTRAANGQDSPSAAPAPTPPGTPTPPSSPPVTASARGNGTGSLTGISFG